MIQKISHSIAKGLIFIRMGKLDLYNNMANLYIHLVYNEII